MRTSIALVLLLAACAKKSAEDKAEPATAGGGPTLHQGSGSSINDIRTDVPTPTEVPRADDPQRPPGANRVVASDRPPASEVPRGSAAARASDEPAQPTPAAPDVVAAAQPPSMCAAHLAEVKRCAGSATGKVVVSFTVGADGSVVPTTVQAPGDATAACVKAKATGWKIDGKREAGSSASCEFSL